MSRRADTTARAVSVGVVAAGVAIVGMLLSGFAVPGRSTDAAPPLSSEVLDQRRTAFIDALWAPVAEEYPEAIRPEVEFGRVVDDRSGRTARMVCLRESGISSKIDRGRVVYRSGQGKTPVELAVGNYSCSVRHPNIRDVTADLNGGQLEALWDYYTTVTRPCLAAIGQSTWIPPGRRDYSAEDGHHIWNPYLPLRGPGHSEEQLDALESRCPAVPAWLDFRSV